MDDMQAALRAVRANLVYWRDSRGEFTPTADELSDSIRRIDAALAAPAQPGSRFGWKLVPLEPTQAMLDAAEATPGIVEVNGVLATHFVRTRTSKVEWAGNGPPLTQAWAAMLAATPTSPCGHADRTWCCTART